jgi:hypothetical protein
MKYARHSAAKTLPSFKLKVFKDKKKYNRKQNKTEE